MVVYRSPAVTLEDFDRPVCLDVLHQPFVCQTGRDETEDGDGAALLPQSAHSLLIAAVLRCCCRRLQPPAASYSAAFIPRRVAQNGSA